jgi:hypothetical protein
MMMMIHKYSKQQKHVSNNIYKPKAVPLHATKVLGGGEEIQLLHILDHSTRWDDPASRPDRALPPVPIVQEAGWDPEPVWTQRLEEKSFASDGNQTSILQYL